TLEQDSSGAIAAPERDEQQRQPRELRHGGPVGRNEAHDGETEEDSAEDGEDRRHTERRSARLQVGADGGGARLVHPAGGLPAREVALDSMTIPGHEPSVAQFQLAPAWRDIIERCSVVKWPWRWHGTEFCSGVMRC